MLTTIGLGILASLASEAITWLNSKLSGTVLKGDGAFLLAAFIALIGAGFKVWYSGIPLNNLRLLWDSFAQVWVISQVFFIAVVQALNIDVKDNSRLQ